MFLAWLLLLAIPLQGLTAASMAHCGAPSGGAAQARTGAGLHDGAHHRDQALAMQHHLSHQHAGHDHAAQARAHGWANGTADSLDSTVGESAATGALPDVGHKCSVCAACCHGAAINDTARPPAAAGAARAVRSETFVAVPDRAGAVPDKPPRA